jgi:hypothetical protein
MITKSIDDLNASRGGSMTSSKEKCVTLISKRNIVVIKRISNPAPSKKDNTKPMLPKLFIAGAPASGKGMQCKLIKQKYGVVYLSTGDMLRAAVTASTNVGKQVKDYMDAKKWVPNDVIIGVVMERLAMPDCLVLGWILNGFPCTPAQAKTLADAGITANCFNGIVVL